MKKYSIRFVFLSAMALITFGAQVTHGRQNSATSAKTVYQQALHEEEATGNVKAAINLYQRVLSAKPDRGLAAQTLIRMAECYQKLGDGQARKIFEQVVSDYSDQKEAAAVARERLGRSAVASRGHIGTQQLWTVPASALGVNAPGGLGSVSPDGRYIPFVDWSTGNLKLHDFQTGNDRQLTTTARTNAEYAEESVISRDGKRVAYAWFNTDGYELRVLDLNVTGASPRVLFANRREIPWVFPYDWSPDGKWIAAQLKRADGTGQIALVSVSDGVLRVLKSSDWRRAGGIVFSPDSRYLAYDIAADNNSEQHDIHILATDGSREISAIENPANDVVLGWAPNGKHLVFASNRSGANGIWTLPIADGKPDGESRLIQSDLNLSLGRAKGLSRSGALYYNVGLSQQDIYVASVDVATGKLLSPPSRIGGQVGFNLGAAWSPDGKSLAYLPRKTDVSVVAIQSVATGKVRELRPDLAYVFSEPPLWSPDSTFLVLNGPDHKGRWGLYRVSLQTGETAPLVMSLDPAANTVHAQGWSADGGTLYFRRRGLLCALDVQSGRERQVDGISPTFALSPDGRSWAFIDGPAPFHGSDKSKGFSSLQIVPVDGGQAHELFRVSAPEDLRSPSWSPDGRFLLFYRTDSHDVKGRAELWSVPVAGGTPQKIDLGGVAPALPPNDTEQFKSFRVHPDGHRIVLEVTEPKSEIWVMENLLTQIEASY